MGVMWHKVWHDLRSNKTRTLLAVLSIAVGVFAVGAIFGMDDQMLGGMDRSHQASLPSHITIYLTAPVDRETAMSIRKVPGVEDVEVQNSVAVRYKLPNDDKWRQGNLLLRDDYEAQKYDLLQLREGVWPRGNGLGIERMHAPFYGVGIGDQITLEVNSRERAFPLTSIIRHPFSPPPQMGYDMAFFFCSPEVLEYFGVPQGKFTELRVRVSPYSLDNAKLVASEIKDRLAKQGTAVGATMYQDPEKHWGRAFMDSMVLMMRVMAIISLALSAVLVLNTLTALITQQTSQIGAMKAVGGTARSIASVYLAGVVVYGLLALAVALPLGAMAAASFTEMFLALFNIEYPTFEVSTKALVFQTVAALIVPVLAGLAPVMHGARITIREAIASYGLGGDFGSSGLDRTVERVAGRLLPTQYAISLANMFRRKGRLALTQLTLVVAGAMFLVFMSLGASMTGTLDAEFDRRGYDLALQFDSIQRIDRVVDVANSVDGVAKADMYFVHSASVLRQGQRTREAGVGTQVLGVPPEDAMDSPMIIRGRWLRPDDGRALVVSKELAEDNGLSVGDTVSLDLAELGRDDWQIVGISKQAFASGMDMTSLYVPRQALLEAVNRTGRGQVVLVRTVAGDADSISAVGKSLEAAFSDRNMKVIAVATRQGDRLLADSRYNIVINMVLTLACIVALVGGIGLMGALSIGVIERTKEIGVLRAIGARSRAIVGMFMLEGVLNGFMSWLAAVPISLVVSPIFCQALGRILIGANLEYRYDGQAAVTWLVVVLLVGAMASILPARNAAGISVRASLAYE